MEMSRIEMQHLYESGTRIACVRSSVKLQCHAIAKYLMSQKTSIPASQLSSHDLPNGNIDVRIKH